MRVGLVGVGNLGGPICSRLVGAAHEVRIYDRDSMRLQAVARESGATPIGSVRELAAASEVILTCLPSPAATAAVICGDHGVLEGCASGAIVADLGTNDPATVAAIHRAAVARSIGFLDCPVAGGVPGAESGTLTVFVGGDAADLGRIHPVLIAFSHRIVHLGGAGAGSVAKIANNFLAFGNLMLAAEAFLYAKGNGVEPSTLLEALEGSSGGSTILERFQRKVLPREFSPEFTIELASKDLRLALALASSAGVPTYFGGLLAAIFQEATAAGLNTEDLAAVVKVLERAADSELADEAKIGLK